MQELIYETNFTVAKNDTCWHISVAKSQYRKIYIKINHYLSEQPC